MSIEAPRILFLHGLESTVDEALRPVGRKVQWLRAHYDRVIAPALDTREAQQIVAWCRKTQTPWKAHPDKVAAAFATPLVRAREALAEGPDLVIGSSFGGAVLHQLVHAGDWPGPCVFLAAAGAKLTFEPALPQGAPALYIHGRRDDVVDPDDSRRFAEACGAPLWEVDDDHRLATILDNGLLAAAVAWSLSR